MLGTVGMHNMRIFAWTTTKDTIVVMILTFARCGSTVVKDRMRWGIVVWTTGIVLNGSARCIITVEMDRMRRGIVVWTTGIVLNGSARCVITVEMDRTRRGIVVWTIRIVLAIYAITVGMDKVRRGFIVWTTEIVATALNAGARCGIIVEVHRRRGGIVVFMTTVGEGIVLIVGTRCGTGVGLVL